MNQLVQTPDQRYYLRGFFDNAERGKNFLDIKMFTNKKIIKITVKRDKRNYENYT